jgi:polyisoprenoid-binding protein YceI
MKKITLSLLLLMTTVVVFAQNTWKSDPMHSRLGFGITHLGISEVNGLFKTFDVTVNTNKADFSDATFELTTDVNSIDTEIEMRDNHLRSADFFDVAKYPKLTFKSTSIKKVKKNKYKITGDLTFHGVTKSVTMDLVYNGTVENPMSKAETAGFQLTGAIKRSDFNLGAGFPAPMISDLVTIKADGEFVKK